MVFADSRNVKPGPNMNEFEKRAFLRVVDKHYPFGERKHFPYKAWLKERKKVIEWLWPMRNDVHVGLFKGLEEVDG